MDQPSSGDRARVEPPVQPMQTEPRGKDRRASRRRPWLLPLALVAVVATGVFAYLELRPDPRWFARDSVWNTELEDDAPLAPKSKLISDRLRREVASQREQGYGPWMNIGEYSSPVYTVGPDQPTVEVRDAPDPEQWPPAMTEAFKRVPIPRDAKEAKGTDAHLVVWQPSTDTMWEFWVARKTREGWTARWGGIIENVSDDPGYYTGEREHWGASGTSLPIVAGMVTHEDLERGRIDHALALAIPDAAYARWVWPAQRSDGQDIAPDAIPEGTQFRIDPDVDLEQLRMPRLTRMLAEAAQRYGFIVRDRASVVTFFGEDPTPTGRDPWKPQIGDRKLTDLIGAFPWQHVQALDAEEEKADG